MPIKAKHNGSYKDITDLMNVDESIDYVLAKTSSSYKRVYTATRSIEDTPPTTFKSIKPGANLTDYRIYGNTSKNILPLSKTPKTETIGDIFCEYDGKGTFKFTSNVDNPTYTQDQWFWVPFEEDFDFPVGISDGGHGCIQLNNDFATGYGVTPYFVGFGNRGNGEFVSGFNVAGTAPNVVDTNYYTEDLEGLPANCITFQYLQQIGKRTVTIKPALYLDIRTQQPFEPYGESVGDRTGNLFDGSFIHRSVIQVTVSADSPNRRSTVVDISNFNNGDIITFSRETSAGNMFQMYQVTSPLEGGQLLNDNVISGNSETLLATMTLDNISKYPYLMIFLNGASQPITDEELLASKIMVNVGNTPLPYEPYGYKVPVMVEGKNILPMSTTPISTDVDDFHCEYDGAGTITLTTDKDNAVLNNFSIPLSEEFIIPVSVGQGGNGCIQINNSIAASANSNTDYISVDFWYNSTFIDGWRLKTINRISSTYSSMGGKTINRLLIDIKGTGFSTNRKIVIRPAFILNTTEQVSFEPYHVPVTTPIYLPEQIRKVGDEAEYIDYATQKQHRVRKNLLQNTATSQTIDGVTFTVNSDRSVTCNGTANNVVLYEIYSIPRFSGECILSGCPMGGSQNTYRLQYTNLRTLSYKDYGTGVNIYQFDEIQYPTSKINIRIERGYTCNNLTFYPMIRKADIEDDTYEPYIEDTDVDVTLPALPTLPGTNVLSVGTEVQPSKIDITGHIKTISGGS